MSNKACALLIPSPLFTDYFCLPQVRDFLFLDSKFAEHAICILPEVELWMSKFCRGRIRWSWTRRSYAKITERRLSFRAAPGLIASCDVEESNSMHRRILLFGNLDFGRHAVTLEAFCVAIPCFGMQFT